MNLALWKSCDRYVLANPSRLPEFTDCFSALNYYTTVQLANFAGER
jgi:hypothetical protein